MTMSAIDAVTSLQAHAGPEASVATSAMQPADFGRIVEQGMAKVDQALGAADQNVRELAAGHDIAPHDLMISLEEARMHLMLFSEVRNRLVEGYQELSRMQL
ncbi:flagellar hook-basal body complex protein FliE [Xanthomonas sacchari]|uniref:flagellar hook-basal body complex protein FliE n=1 Tax=Xanthomonas sacchari TaxID=56458 RepID=UPI00225DDCB3|nr:flagellar hook-basal body complex protein FliE [Xanthomonas sacchari]